MPTPSGDQFKNVPHPDSDPTEENSFNMLGCGIDGCNADFDHPMTRAWHINKRHPGLYSGPSDDMDIFERVTGIDLGMGKRYTFKKDAPKPVRGVDFGAGID